MATVKEAIKESIETKDLKRLNRLIQTMRFCVGMNYQQSYEFVNKIVPMSLADFDSLMGELDSLES